jgi:Ca2+/H+ antiporter, TMEM165/GDT1 family
MDWKIAAATFSSVFLAEIGDKTQLMTLTLAGAGSKWSVWVGAAAALVATTTIAVLVGEVATQVLPAVWLKRAAGSIFLLLGVYFLWSTRSAGVT